MPKEQSKRWAQRQARLAAREAKALAAIARRRARLARQQATYLAKMERALRGIVLAERQYAEARALRARPPESPAARDARLRATALKAVDSHRAKQQAAAAG